MASTTAMFTGLSGLNANARNLDVIGNNIANVNTTAFKTSRMMFETQFSRNFSIGSVPGATTGGTNPGQIGLGVKVAGTQRDFRPGTISPTGDQRDLAIEGDGFFIVRRGEDETMFTRAGAFRQNSANELVTIDGDRLQGYTVDDEFNIVEGALVDLVLPVGDLTVAEATQNVRMSGNLNADGEIATAGSRTALMGTETGGFGLVSTAAPVAAGNVLEVGSLLTQIEDPDQPGTDVPLFAPGQVIEMQGVEKGEGGLLPTRSLTIDATTTVQQFMDFMNESLGIQETGVNPNGRTPGVSLDPTTGVLTVDGNVGVANGLDIDTQDFRLMNADGTLAGLPFVTSTLGEATGESVRTSFVVFDSLGTAVDVDLSIVLESTGDAGTTWRYFVDAPGGTAAALDVATGQIRFDTSGQPLDTVPVTLNVQRAGTGAVSPLSFVLDFADDTNRVTALTDVTSQIAATFRDGSPIGTLTDFGVGTDGVITGSFSNGLTRTIGQVPVSTFSNAEGLVDQGDNLFTVGPNSGQSVVSTAGTFGAGPIIGGALELSNVDLGEEFIDMIVAQTGYNASSRVIQTSDELLQRLLSLGL